MKSASFTTKFVKNADGSWGVTVTGPFGENNQQEDVHHGSLTGACDSIENKLVSMQDALDPDVEEA